MSQGSVYTCTRIILTRVHSCILTHSNIVSFHPNKMWWGPHSKICCIKLNFCIYLYSFHCIRDRVHRLCSHLQCVTFTHSLTPPLLVLQSMKLKLQPPSGTELPPFNPILPPASITQVMLLANPLKVRAGPRVFPGKVTWSGKSNMIFQGPRGFPI